MYKKHKIGVVIPAYNEGALISKTLSTLPDFVDRIFVINDGSRDNTPTLAYTPRYSLPSLQRMFVTI